MTQSEQILEDKLVKQLGSLGYDFVAIKDEEKQIMDLMTELK